MVIAGGTAAAVAAVSGSSSGSPHATPPGAPSHSSGPSKAAQLAAAQASLAAEVSVSPASGATAVALNSTIKVATATGALTSVRVTDPTGAAVPGTPSASGLTWASSTPLKPSTTYHVVAVVASNGISAERSTTFTTLTPTYLVDASLFPRDGMTVGVGQPIVFTFTHWIETPAGQAAAYPHIHVSMSKPVAGGWYWFSDTELHFRPETFWPTGEKVTVTANFNGWNGSNGRWGEGTVSSTFTVGASHVATANLATHVMTVTDNGAVIATYPISAGSTVYPTMNGTHIVMDKESVVHMVSSTVGIPVNSSAGYDEYVYDDVHISDSGEYVHAAPWSVYAQGTTNVSHGCINVSPTNALSFFNYSVVGDVIQVIGGPRPPVVGDHGVMDWDTPWSHWAPAHVGQLA